MAQVYKMMLGTSGRQWEQLTVREDGTMMLYFHGTDRSVTTQVTLVEDGAWKGWLRSEGGSLYPGIESGKWNKMEDVRGLTADVVETTENHAEAEECESPIINEPIPSQQQMNLQTEVTESPIINEPITNHPRPRRQRKPRKAVATTARRNGGMTESRHSGISGYRDYDTAASSGATAQDDHAWLRSVGYLAAASVALLVIWQTGLIIPLGLLGLATSGFLK